MSSLWVKLWPDLKPKRDASCQVVLSTARQAREHFAVMGALSTSARRFGTLRGGNLVNHVEAVMAAVAARELLDLVCAAARGWRA